MKILPFALAAFFGVNGTCALAQGIDTGWYVAPTVSAVINDSSRTADLGVGVGLAIGKALNDKWNAELSAQYMHLDGSADKHANISADALYFFNRNPHFSPYLSLGLGYAREGKNNDNVITKAGLGFTKKLTNTMDFRTEARYQWHGNKAGANSLGDLAISVGLNIHFQK